MLDSALARPQQKFAYEEGTDIATLAAAYGFGLAKNHAFVDGNKRAAFVSIGLFLALNGYQNQLSPLVNRSITNNTAIKNAIRVARR